MAANSSRRCPWNRRTWFKAHVCLLGQRPGLSSSARPRTRRRIYSERQAEHSRWSYYGSIPFPRLSLQLHLLCCAYHQRPAGPPILKAASNHLEVKSCQENGYDTIIFYDDCLFVRGAQLNARIDEFASSLSAAGWSGAYQLELRADAVVAMSAEALESLVGSGCRQINMGIEKGHSAALHQMRKRLTPEIPREAVERLNAAGIRAAGTFIIGGIGEVPADASAVGDYAASLALDFAQFNP